MKKLVVFLAALALLVSVGLKTAPAIHAAPATHVAPTAPMLGTCHMVEETWSGWQTVTGAIQQATELYVVLDANGIYCGQLVFRTHWHTTDGSNMGCTPNTAYFNSDMYLYQNYSFSTYTHWNSQPVSCKTDQYDSYSINGVPENTPIYAASWTDHSFTPTWTHFGTGTGWYTGW